MKISVKEAAIFLGKDPSWVRAGIISGWLPIGVATRNGKQITDIKEISSKLGRINYYISPSKFKEYCGYERSKTQ